MVTAVTLGLTLAFEPTELGAMRRPPRSPREPLLSRRLLWRIGFVSLLFVTGAFGVFFYAVESGLSVELARTMVVNTIVVMEIFYLFSVRYIHGPSITWQGIFGTPAVLTGVALVVAAQFAFTYLPFMQAVFDTAPIAPLNGLLIIGVGIALLFLVELEKRVSAGLPPEEPSELQVRLLGASRAQILVPLHTYPDGNADNIALHAAAIARHLNADVHALVLNADFHGLFHFSVGCATHPQYVCRNGATCGRERAALPGCHARGIADLRMRLLMAAL